MKRPLAFLLLCGLSLAAQADPARVIRATDLKDRPFTDAATVLPLAKMAAVEVLTRQGGWYKVKVQGKEGWVRMSALRLGDGSAKPGDSGIGMARRFLTTGRSGSSGVTVATGVRGLEAADITNAVADPGAVAAMDQSAVNADEARRHAGEQGLRAQDVAHLPDPKQAEKKN